MTTYNSQSGKMSLGSGGSRSARRGRMMGQPGQGGLSTRAASPAGGKKNRGNRSAPSGQLSAEDVIKIFQATPVPNRGFKNPNADQPAKMGQGMAWFDANNSPKQVAGRQQRVDTARQKELNGNFVDAATAVDFAKQTKGYTDASGRFVPPTMPSTPSSKYGSGSVSFTDKLTGGTMTDHMGRTVKMSDYLPQQSLVQDSKFGAMPGQENGGALTRPRPPQVQQSAQPQNDMAALFPGPNVAPMPTQTQPTFAPGDAVFVGLPMDTPGAASDMARRSSPFLPQGQAASPQASAPAEPSWFERKIADNPDGIFGKIAEVGGMMPEMPQMPALSQNGILPDLWNGLAAGGLGVGDIYANTIGRPLDQFLFGIQPPAEPSNNMEQYQKSKNMKQGWW